MPKEKKEMPGIFESLTFDDVLLLPSASDVQPSDVDTRTRVTRSISLNIPLLSAAMDTVTEANMAISMAQAGGLGVIHRNLDPGVQADQVRRVKRYESGMVDHPITIRPDATLAEALAVMKDYRISGIPVTKANGKLVGILSNRDVRFAENQKQKISELMTSENLVTANRNISKEKAKKLLHKHRIEKLIIVDGDGRCTGLITVKDIEKSQLYPTACKDSEGRLRVGAAIGTGEKNIFRAEALIDEEVDFIVIDTAHGHSKGVIDMVKKLRSLHKHVQVVAGNIATAEAAKALIDAGADALKVGIGPGSICTTRIVAGVGVPQLSAIGNVAKEAQKSKIPVIADGGIRSSGDFAKAIASGADCAMLGGMFAGTDEAPGDVIFLQGRSYKAYRGMGSIGAMMQGSADRYSQVGTDSHKLVPEGVEGRVPYKGAVAATIHQMVGGLRSSMGYIGCKTIEEMKRKAKFTRITSAGYRESHVHDVTITREVPNYRTGE